ncbi:hypothetical protein NCAS_0C01050 [Naumovozyma castellii]|uniref:Pre-mRNA-splicing factor CEF1 n=1 Tax=Naumovozyma castellii TaxID=27288 RepID=G0VC86_NAUCA|nr:hypothetical protein NCAS_0C01050 [Naumovozyma castellii CBS 4309]CCC69095.1 hypothetical protein NCAS_0C01050 [Naumovozyma castellii CBS 4309]
MAPIPIYVKGGVWTNIEDQIVKAAVQKYGTHQWNKIASLLQKKTARQCQIRWDEFLNPSLNFKEFSKDEDAKLLDLARRLPNQWRTIADLMGRTAQFCIERYNKLLSSDEDGEEELGLSSSLDFKIGDVNPNAETQIAKADKEGLDDEEREMLADARARLLNTQGKKATRKIRERMLEESKRIAQLQKRRELKQSGINTKISKGKKKYESEIDYNEDIAYEQPQIAGLYDTSKEKAKIDFDFERFEKKVDKMGMRNERETIEKREKGRRKRRQEIEPQPRLTKIDDSILLNDFKKPKLILSKPGIELVQGETIDRKRQRLLDSKQVGTVLKRESQEHELPVLYSGNNYNPDDVDLRKTQLSRKQKASYIAQLFKTLPNPSNNFEIDMEDLDESEDEINDESNVAPNLTSEPDETESILLSNPPIPIIEISSLKNEGELPIPDIIDLPSTEIEKEFNHLVMCALTSSDYDDMASFSEYYQQVTNELTQRSQEPKLDSRSYSTMAVDLPPQAELLKAVNAQIESVQTLQDKLLFVQPLVKENEYLCKELCGSTLPKIRTSQGRYFVDYKLYQQEMVGISSRKTRLQNYVNESKLD